MINSPLIFNNNIKIITRLLNFQCSCVSSADCLAASLLIIARRAKIRNSEATKELNSIIVKKEEPLQPSHSVNLFRVSAFFLFFGLFFYHSIKNPELSM